MLSSLMPNSLLCLAVVSVLSLASIACCQSVHIEIRLHRTAEQEDPSCFEQNLTRYSGNNQVQLEHRLLNTSLGGSHWGEWALLLAIDLADTSPGDFESINLTSLDQTTPGVQLRLVQLEHGGGRCSCWELEELSAILQQQDSENSINPRSMVGFSESSSSGEISAALCHSEYRNKTRFCGGSIYETRGVVLKALYLPTANESDSDVMIASACPGGSNDSLFEAPFRENCSGVTLRM